VVSGYLIMSVEEKQPEASATQVLVTTVAELARHAGRKLGPTRWRSITQAEVDQFADLTDDHNFIHVDPARARSSPFGGTIAHGFLTLSFLGPISQELIVVRDAATAINYGLNKLRFPSPLRVGSRFRGVGEIVEVAAITGGNQVTATFTIEIEDAPKPALVAESLLRYYA
jgi:acyl dehydratase